MPDQEDERIQDAIAAYASRIARLGGIARAKKLTAAKRKAIATKASKAAAKKRTAKKRKAE
jgi:hypothetical protein